MQIYGHRGAKAEAPENSLEGFAYLRSLGINRVELDLRLVRNGLDNELIVLHDPTVDRTARRDNEATRDLSGSYKQFTLPQLRQLGFPTLRETVAAWSNLQAIQLEVKTDTESGGTEEDDYFQAVALQLIEVIQEHNLERSAIITSIDPDFLKVSRSKLPSDIYHGIVIEKSCTDLEAALSKAQALNCQYFIPHYSLITPRLVEQVKERAMHLSTWTVNDPQIAQQLKAWNVGSIITDIPKEMLEHIV